MLDVTTKNIKQFVAIYALKQMSVFQEEVATESDNETLEDSDEWILSDDSVSLDSDNEIINDSDHESDEHSVEVAEQNVDRVEIQPDSNVPVWERIETIEDEIAIEQGKKLVATYSDKPAEDIDPLWFLLVFPDCFPNAQGLAGNNVSVKRWLSYLIQIDGSRFQSNAFVCAADDCIMRHGVNLAAHLQFKTYLNKLTKQPMNILNAQRRSLLSEEKQAYMIQQKLKLYASKLLQFLHAQSVHLTMPLIIEGKCLQDGHILVHLVFFLLLTLSKPGVLFVGNYAMLILFFNIILI